MIILCQHVMGDVDHFEHYLKEALTNLQNNGANITDIKYDSTYMQSADEWYVMYSALIIYNIQSNESTTAATINY